MCWVFIKSNYSYMNFVGKSFELKQVSYGFNEPLMVGTAQLLNVLVMDVYPIFKLVNKILTFVSVEYCPGNGNTTAIGCVHYCINYT